jgi:hypothetical protein
MARIHIDEDDSLPDLADLLKASKQSPRKKTQPTTRAGPRQAAERSALGSQQVDIAEAAKPTTRRKVSENGEEEEEKYTRPRQRALKKVENNARLASASKERVRITTSEDNVDKKTKVPKLKLGKLILPRLPSIIPAPKEEPVAEQIQPVLPSTWRPTSSSDNDNDKSAFLI